MDGQTEGWMDEQKRDIQTDRQTDRYRVRRRTRERERDGGGRERDKFLGLPRIREHIFGNKFLVSKFGI
jgi:hypothetical protein